MRVGAPEEEWVHFKMPDHQHKDIISSRQGKKKYSYSLFIPSLVTAGCRKISTWFDRRTRLIRPLWMWWIYIYTPAPELHLAYLQNSVILMEFSNLYSLLLESHNKKFCSHINFLHIIAFWSQHCLKVLYSLSNIILTLSVSCLCLLQAFENSLENQGTCTNSHVHSRPPSSSLSKQET